MYGVFFTGLVILLLSNSIVPYSSHTLLLLLGALLHMWPDLGTLLSTV